MSKEEVDDKKTEEYYIEWFLITLRLSSQFSVPPALFANQTLLLKNYERKRKVCEGD